MRTFVSNGVNFWMSWDHDPLELKEDPSNRKLTIHLSRQARSETFGFGNGEAIELVLGPEEGG